jgi:hypothetical protein
VRIRLSLVVEWNSIAIDFLQETVPIGEFTSGVKTWIAFAFDVSPCHSLFQFYPAPAATKTPRPRVRMRPPGEGWLSFLAESTDRLE